MDGPGSNSHKVRIKKILRENCILLWRYEVKICLLVI